MASERNEHDTISKDCSPSYRRAGNDYMFVFFKNCLFYDYEDPLLSLNLNFKVERLVGTICTYNCHK